MIQYLLFDLDNTLYSPRYGLEDNVSRRIRQYLASYLGLPPEEAWRQRTASGKYGTTLEWLVMEKNLTDPEDYFSAIHPRGEADTLTPDPALGTFLKSLGLPMAILTNSPREHAELILEKLELGNLFTHIFDIRLNGFKGKPHKEAFENALDTLGMRADQVLFIDDYPHYVEGYLALGGRGLLIDELDAHKEYPHDRIRSLHEIERFLD
jgi:putative hydrolase of the HAD superfamily